MSLTPSSMLPLGSKAPNFTLTDVVTDEEVSLKDIKSDIATVVMFICNHCPFVKHIQKTLVKVANEYMDRGITFVAINSNDIEAYPDDSPAEMKRVAEYFDYPFAYLFDATQQTAKAYHAACTPDFFVFDKEMKCVYRGQFDDSRPGHPTPVTGKDLCQALDNILAGKAIDPNQKPSIGCNIKWKYSH